MKKIAAIIPLALLAWAMTIEHPRMETSSDFGNELAIENAQAPAAVFATSLADSMPPGWMQAVGLDNVPGFKISSVSGHTASYFEYQAEHQDLLSAFSLLPFHKSVSAADTTVRPITLADVLALRTHLSASELDKATNFWSAATPGIEAYQCLKPPFMHTILINPTTKKVYHRIETV